MPSTNNTQKYLLGDHQDEFVRLESQHRIWAEITYACWRKAGFGPGQTILDLGCGPGFCSRELAFWLGEEGKVISVDASERFITHLQQKISQHGLHTIQPVLTSIEQLALDSQIADGAFARWLFCFLSGLDQAIEAFADTIRPGGRLAVIDYFNYRSFTMAPRSAAMDQVVAAISQSWLDNGGSLDVLGILPQKLEKFGFKIISVKQVSGITYPGRAHWYWPKQFLHSYLPRLIEQEALSVDVVSEFWQDWQRAEQSQSSFLVLPPMLELIVEKR